VRPVGSNPTGRPSAAPDFCLSSRSRRAEMAVRAHRRLQVETMDATGTPASTEAKRPRVLVVEDEYLVAMLVEDMLDALGFEVGEIAQDLAAATKAAEHGEFDVAVLDVNLDGSFSNPVAEILSR